MSECPDTAYFTHRAANARGMAARAATPAARHIHLELAADYDQKAGVPATIHRTIPETR